MANSVDPDQMPHSAASDLGLHCLQRLSVPILRVFTVSQYYYLLMLIKQLDWRQSFDTDQTLHYAASDLDCTVCSGFLVWRVLSLQEGGKY